MVRGGGARQALGGGLVVPGDRKATEDPGLCGGWRKVRKCSGHEPGHTWVFDVGK